MLTSLLKVRYPLHGDERIGFDFEIGWKEYASIGYVVVQWAFLEYALHERIVAFAKRARIKVPKNARSFSFSKRVRVLRELISKTIKDPNANERWLDLLSRISNAAGRRQKVAHGLWAYNPARAERLWTEGANQKSKRADKFDFKELGEFGASIGQLSFELALYVADDTSNTSFALDALRLYIPKALRASDCSNVNLTANAPYVGNILHQL